jgi:hypothetical protein
MRYIHLSTFCLLTTLLVQTPDALRAQAYQTPPKPLADLVTVAPTPSVSVSGKGDYLLILERAANPTIAELSQPEFKLAGLRLNPATNGPSRTIHLTGLRLKKMPNGSEAAISGLPTPAQLGNR